MFTYNDSIIGINKILKFDLMDIIHNGKDNDIINALIKFRKFGRCVIHKKDDCEYSIVEKYNYIKINCNNNNDLITVFKYKCYVPQIYKNLYDILKSKRGLMETNYIIEIVESQDN